MRERVRLLLAIYGLLLVAAGTAALKPTRPKFKIATTSTTTTTTEEPEEPEVTTVQSDVNATTSHTLTGIPQIDYIWDPNLPRELNGYNLSTYPFYSTVPTEEIHFKCDGLHDGFYASIEHKCQVYHHCLYGTRYDFLCANFTAFDQKTFICHFASEVDCANSKKYWHRNDALYQATTTTTSSTTTTTTVAPPATVAAPAALPPVRPGHRDRDGTRRRRPFRRRPAYDYYDDEYYDDEYDRTRPRGYDRRDSYEYDDRSYRTDGQRDRDRDRDYRDPVRDHGPRYRERDQRPLYDDRDQREREKITPGTRPGRRDRRPLDQFDDDTRPLIRDKNRDTDQAGYSDTGKPVLGEERRKESTDFRNRDSPRDSDDIRYSEKRYRNDYEDKDPTPVSTGSISGLVKPAAPSTSVYARPRAPPKIRRPVPVSEQEKYAYNVSSVAKTPTPTVSDEPRRRPDPIDDDYPEDDVEDPRPRRPMRRRPAYRDKEASYDARENRDRDRDRDRNYRTRYQDETEDEVIPRKRLERPRDRLTMRDRGERLHGYDRERSPAVTERPAPPQYPNRSGGLLNTRPLNRDEDFNRPLKYPARERDPPMVQSEVPKKPSYYNQRSEKTFSENPPPTYKNQNNEDHPGAAVEEVEEEVEEERPRDDVRIEDKNAEKNKFTEPDYLATEEPSARPSTGSRGSQKYEEVSSEYYDEAEELPASSPRTTLRIVKRPFLPSRGGNPNPRGLKQVGSRIDQRPEEESIGRQTYDAYRTIQSDNGRPQQIDESPDSVVAARPQSRRLQKEDTSNSEEDSTGSYDHRQTQSGDLENRGRGNNDDNNNNNNHNRQSSQQYRNGQFPPESNSRHENYEGAKPNEVLDPLKDIPESEYDVTLNDALTPTLAQESSLPSGFIIPLHRQLDRDANLQSSQRNYQLTRPQSEQIAQIKSLPSSQSSSYSVPPIHERSRSTFPRNSQGSVFAPVHQQAPWQGYIEY